MDISQVVLGLIACFLSLFIHLSFLLALFRPTLFNTFIVPPIGGPSWLLLLSINVLDIVSNLLSHSLIFFTYSVDIWYFGEAMCRLSAFLRAATLTMTSWGYSVLLFLCYLMAFKKSKLKSISTLAKKTLLVGSVWLLSLVSSAPRLLLQTVAIYKGLGENGDPHSVECPVPEGHFNLTLALAHACGLPNRTEVIELPFCDPTGFLATEDGQLLYLLFQFLIPLVCALSLASKIFQKTKNFTVSGEQKKTVKSPKVLSAKKWKYIQSIIIITAIWHLFMAPKNLLLFFPNWPYQIRRLFTIVPEFAIFIKPHMYLLYVKGVSEWLSSSKSSSSSYYKVMISFKKAQHKHNRSSHQPNRGKRLQKCHQTSSSQTTANHKALVSQRLKKMLHISANFAIVKIIQTKAKKYPHYYKNNEHKNKFQRCQKKVITTTLNIFKRSALVNKLKLHRFLQQNPIDGHYLVLCQYVQ